MQKQQLHQLQIYFTTFLSAFEETSQFDSSNTVVFGDIQPGSTSVQTAIMSPAVSRSI